MSVTGINFPEDSFSPEKNKAGNPQKLPVTVKVDLDTPLETGLQFLAKLSLACGLIMLGIALKPQHPVPELLKYVPWLFVFSAVCWFLRKNIDNYYVINRSPKKILYHFHFFGYQNVTTFLEFQDVLGIGVTGIPKKKYQEYWFEYLIQLVDCRGAVYELSDPKREHLKEVNAQGQMVAEMVGCPFYACPGKMTLITDKSPEGRITIVHKDCDMIVTTRTSAEKVRMAIFFVAIGVPLFLAIMYDLIR